MGQNVVLIKLPMAENPLSVIYHITNFIQPCYPVETLRNAKMKLAL
jgi:hypothetical protein